MMNFFKLIDLNKTARHVSMGEMRRRNDRLYERTVSLFRLIVVCSAVVTFAFWLWH